MTIVDRSGADYPRRLVALGWDKPIHVRGVLPPDAGPAVAIVGARAASGTGMQRAHAIAKHLGDRGVHVVSGGALGIDGAAHRGALAGAGTTTVVLGSGIDVLYPVRHAPMFDAIVARGGGLVSLLPLGTEPRRHTFLGRNPLIAALADVTIVVEASPGSGSLSTALAARKLGKIVAAWPGTRGCEWLLANGAAIVESEADALAAVLGTPRPRPVIAHDPITAQVADAIAAGATDVDAIVSHTGLSVRAVLRALPLIHDVCVVRKL